MRIRHPHPIDMPNNTTSTRPDSHHPLDWDAFWATSTDERRSSAHVGQFGKAALLEAFFERRTVPSSFVSFGCGPGACPIDLGRRYPSMNIVGLDASTSAVEAARTTATKKGLENVRFAVDELPDPSTTDRFDVVYCYATLHYIRSIEHALTELYDLVAEGGTLIFNYPNRLTRSTYRRMLEGEQDRPLPGSPAEFRQRFHRVLNGENLLSYDRIAQILGSRPISFWSVVDPPDEPWVGRDNPFVFVNR